MRILFIYFIFLFCIQQIAFSQHYNFTNFSVGEGLPQSQIYAMFEDSRGYLWFGSNGGGISRFDGISFTNFNEDAGLNCSAVKCIAEDNEANLWIGTEEGIFIFDGKKFKQFTASGFPTNTIIKALIKDKNNNFWIGTQTQGLFKYANKKTEQFSEKNGLLSNVIHHIFCDSKGNIWIGTESGVNKINGNTVIKYSKKEGFPLMSVRSIVEDLKGKIWFCAYGGGVCSYYGKSFERYSTKDGLCNNTVFTALCDKRGNLWFGTAIGVSFYNGKTFRTMNESEGLCSNVIFSLLQDSDNNIWFGSSGGGVSKLDNERFIHFPETDKMGKWVYALAQDKEGTIWLGTSLGGVTKYDGKGFKLIKENGGLTAEKIKALYCDSDGDVWFGSLGHGVFRYNGKGFDHYTQKNGLCGNFITSITSDPSGNIWFASLDRGIGCFNKKTKKFNKFRQKEGLGAERVNTICTTPDGDIFAGLAGAGLSFIESTELNKTKPSIITLNRQKGLSGNTIKSLVWNDGKLYAGTSGAGIDVIKNKNKISTITKKNGLSSNDIYSLIFDPTGNLWVGTEKGLDKIIFEKDKIIQVLHYGKSEGFTEVEANQNSVMLDTDGNIWFGTVNGAVKFNPKHDYKNLCAPKLQICDISIFFDKIQDTKFAGTTPKWSILPEQLNLPYDKNHLSFEFIGIDFKNPHAVKYKWKLIGNDKDWSPVMQKREATYSNLSPGNYTFVVMACNENGIWSKPAEYNFKIQQPFWSSMWFILSLIIIKVLIIWFLVSSRLKRMKKRIFAEKQKLEMEKNILELQQATSRLQMNPHFIFNSLNSIQGYIANNNTTQAKWYLSKFAKLMRLILDNAREEFIPIQDEIDILENYLILEKLSRNDKFDFTISIDNKIDKEAIEIPPMIVQPFVENAVLHGIKYKEGKGNLAIGFTLTDGFLICEITDDGVGREKAREMKEKTSSEHKSSAIIITEERLKGIHNTNNRGASVEIIDLKDENKNAAGTKVIIKIPV